MRCRMLSSLVGCLGLVACLPPSASRAEVPWEPVGLSGGGGMFSPAISPADPNLMMLNCDMSAAYLSEDGGNTWIWWDKTSWAPWRNTCYEVAFDPDTPGKMWGAFSDVHDIPNDNIISERHGHNRPGGVCISRDFGASWKHEARGIPPKPVTSIVLDPKSPKDARTLYAGVFMEGVYKSTDDGKTWSLKKRGLGHPENMRVSRVVLHCDGTLFAMVCAKRPACRKPLMREGVGLYRSTDGAETWEKINASRPFLYPKDFSVHPKNSDVILIGACDSSWEDQSGGLYRTDDGVLYVTTFGGSVWRGPVVPHAAGAGHQRRND